MTSNAYFKQCSISASLLSRPLPPQIPPACERQVAQQSKLYPRMLHQEYLPCHVCCPQYIYYITGESIATVSSSPFLETLQKKGIKASGVPSPCVSVPTQMPWTFLSSPSKRRLASGDLHGGPDGRVLCPAAQGVRRKDQPLVFVLGDWVILARRPTYSRSLKELFGDPLGVGPHISLKPRLQSTTQEGLDIAEEARGLAGEPGAGGW